ncbi:RNA polymerase sigma factor [Dictyobacter alpinus]|uniref:RNA polymerase sigma factor n=1 Tax=Dictyobacter alpinus TaxID=2014873 RepID=A0A402BHG4_9CHLR|nr:RNA polymerase sigma factor [Dictyobacter alpinus]GCE30730.1 RNA polymerase sigma factor [Dictyobacter alpinus]
MSQYDDDLKNLLAINLHEYFQLVVIHYQNRLYTFAYRLCNSQQNAEDIVQEAFVSAYVTLENYPPERIRLLKLQAWLYRVTLNVYTHWLRKTRLHIVPLDLTENNPPLHIEEQPEILFEQLETQKELGQLLAKLPERYRIIITCYYFEHLSYQEIATLLDLPLGTVKSAISRGIRQLRTFFEENNRVQEGREKPWINKDSTRRR